MNRSLVKQYIFAIALFVIATSVLFIYLYEKTELKPEEIVAEFNSNLEKQSKILSQAENEYQNVLSHSLEDYWPSLEKVDDNYNFLVFIYQYDKLIYWNTSAVLLKNKPNKDTTFLVKAANGWYLGKYKQDGEFATLLLDVVELQYMVNNQYINDYFNPDLLDCNHEISIENYRTNYNHRIQFFEHDNYFLSIGEENVSNKISTTRFGLILLFYLILLLFISQFNSRNTIKPLSVQVIPLLSILVLLVFDWYFGFSLSFIGINVTETNATSYSSIIYLIIVLSLCLVFLTNRQKQANQQNLFNNIQSSTRTLVFGFVLIILIIGTSLLVSIIISKSGISEVYLLFNSTPGYAVSLVILLCFSILYLLFVEGSRLLNTKAGTRISNNLIFIVVLAFVLSFSINRSLEKSKDIKQTQIIDFLSQSGDRVVVDYWENFRTALSTDKQFASMLSDENLRENKLENYLYNEYLNKEIKRFESQLTICSKSDLLEFDEGDLVLNCSNYFQEIKSMALDTIANNLYLVNNEPDDIYYIGEIVLSDTLSAYVEFYSFFIPSGLGYAELLIDDKPGVPDLSGYSFAKYTNNQLVSKFGNFEYHTTATVFSEHLDGRFFVLNNYIHEIVSFQNNKILIVSRPVQRLTVELVSFSLLFLLFIAGSLLLTITIYGKSVRQIFHLNFRTRMQAFFMLALISILLSTSLIVMYYTDMNSKEVLEKQMNEKAHSVLIELQHKLKDYSTLELFNKNELGMLLQKFSLVFFSDINLYDTQGRLIATSRPQIFEQGLLSEMINPRAYEEIFVDKLLYYNTTERIGGMEFFSSYLPMVLSGNEIAGIINLPYFARQEEQRHSFRLLLFTFINLFVIFGILGTIIALFYSRLLIRPLTELQQNLASIRIDTKNEKIEWHSNDEIGLLIDEYNSMLDKLEASAEILKRSEREIAWREVAMQIAHEIKNPLTPMKLNIQYLEKSFKDDSAGFEMKLKEISGALIQQIETLNKVAETFSDMAKSSTKKFKEVDLLVSLKTAIKLFDNSNNITFKLQVDSSDNQFITKGLEKEIVQIFNNLLMNSIEAIGDKENGLIEITLTKGVSFHTVIITDNGNGIPASMKQSIFTPYFTTRSKGTGLGLAIVKTLITGMGGDIRLESSGSNGTSFALKFLMSLSTKQN